jgi:conjugative transposon TraM protein
MKLMDKVQRSQAYLRKRKMLVVLPLLIIPFLTMAFWALGGGEEGKGTTVKPQVLNVQLPHANIKDEEQDKLSFYNKAEKDSQKLAEWIRNDPYYTKDNTEIVPVDLDSIPEGITSNYKQPLKSTPYNSNQGAPEEEVMQKLSVLQRQLNQPPTGISDLGKESVRSRIPDKTEFAGEVNRLEDLMRTVSSAGTQDPEMQGLDDMLDKILDIQHPERVKDRIREKSVKNKEMVLAVTREPTIQSISLIDTSGLKTVSGPQFFSLDEAIISSEQNAIEAVIHETQTLVSGAVVKLRLLNDVYIADFLVPKESFVYGLCTLNGERLQVEVNSVRNGNSLFTVKLRVYDLDGLPGIYVPGVLTRDVARQSADNSLKILEPGMMDPSLKTQVASTGLRTVKNLFDKKIKLVRVTVKAGYKVLLRDQKAE